MDKGFHLKRKWWDRIRDTYRISILDDENLEEVGSYNLSLLSFYTLISVIAFVLSALVISFIVFTPVKRLIPGYGDINDNKKFIELSKKVDELEKEVSAYDTYTTGLKNMLTGGIHNSSVEKIDSLEALKSVRPELINQEDLAETSRAKELDFLKFATPVSGKISAGFNPVSYTHLDVYKRQLSGPSFTTISTIFSSQIPSPASRVSSICFLKLSMSLSHTAATPPWA